MRGLRSTIVLLVLLGGLVGYIYFVDSKTEPDSGVEKKDKVFSVEADKIEELTIKSASGTTASLKKSNGKWQLTEPDAAAADETELSGITSNLASLEIQRVVEENAPNLAEFGLEQPRIDVGFRAAGDKEFRHLQIGDKTGTGGDLYAKFPGQKRVFLISSFLEGTFSRTPYELRDKAVLKFDRDKIEALDLTMPESVVSLTRASGEWSLSAPLEARGDYGTIEGIVGRLQSAQMKSIVASGPADVKRYGLDKPQLSVTVSAGSSRATLSLGKESPDGDLYARDASRPLVFAVEKSLLDDLKKPVDDLRRKDIFEFRSFNANRIEIVRGTNTQAFEKTKGPEKDAQEKWRQVAPAAKDVDAAKIESFLSKVSNLRAQSFVDPSKPAGLGTPVAVINVKFDDNKKQEHVTFGRVGADAFAARKDEPGAARLDASEFDGALKALDEIK